MNKDRRKLIQQAWDKLAEVREEIEAIKNDEQDAYDNLPESLQQGERGEAMYDAIDYLESACESIEEATGCLEEAQN
jgi:hypothetical protein